MSKPRVLTEIQAATAIHSALHTFEAEARQRVLRSVMALLDIPSVTPEVHPVHSSGMPSLGGALPATQPAKNIEAFIKSKRPNNNYQRLACLAYYLEHFQQQREVSSKELKQAQSDSRQSPFSNLPLALMHATSSYGFLAPCGKGKKQLTSRGKAVVEALPDQAAVKTALAENPVAGRRRKRKTTK